MCRRAASAVRSTSRRASRSSCEPVHRVRLAARASRNDRAAKTDPYATGLVSFKDQDNRFGFLLAAIYQERNIRRDGFEMLGYAPLSSLVAGNTTRRLFRR